MFRPRSLLAQVLAVNLLLIAATALFATIALTGRGPTFTHRQALVGFGLGVTATLLGNWLLLRQRFAPLQRLISKMEQLDLAASHRPQPPSGENAEVRRLDAAFQRMVARLEAERQAARRAAIAAQERERRRIAQDLHDEVNQALTAVSLRLAASIEHAPAELRRELLETKRLSQQAMEELLALARQLRPAVLDDHGLLAALHSQVRDFGEQSGINASLLTHGSMPPLTPEQQLVIYRITQESLSNVVQHAHARRVEVELSFVGRTILRIADDGRGFDPRERPSRAGRGGGLGLPGMRERALLAGGRLSIFSRPGEGTRVELTIG
jgi:two-component system sensor histidine kinase UhpB